MTTKVALSFTVLASLVGAFGCNGGAPAGAVNSGTEAGAPEGRLSARVVECGGVSPRRAAFAG